jgi:hypothetical protein
LRGADQYSSSTLTSSTPSTPFLAESSSLGTRLA